MSVSYTLSGVSLRDRTTFTGSPRSDDDGPFRSSRSEVSREDSNHGPVTDFLRWAKNKLEILDGFNLRPSYR